MMGEFIVTDALLFLDALICGMLLAIVYDILRIFRRIIPHLNIIVSIEDFVYWNLSGIYIFAVMFGTNNGVIRGFFIVGAVIGAYIYKKSIGEFLVIIIADGINYIINIILKKPVNKVIMMIRKREETANGKKSTEKAKIREHKSKRKTEETQ